MKRTQRKDAWRNIRKQKISFLSIVVIAALGVTMFLGIDFSASAIKKNASAFYNEKNYRDIELVSTLLLSENDLNAIRGTEGIADAEGVCLTEAKASTAETRTNVEVLSLTQRINQPILCEGRLPVAGSECAVERQLADTLGLRVGDTIAVTDAKGNTAQYLLQREYVITGIAVHPDHICTSIPMTQYILVTQDAFDAEALNGCCMKAEIVIDRAADAARFDAAYRNAVSAVLTRLETLGASRAAVREAEVHTQVDDTLAAYRAEMLDAEQALADARAELDQGYIDLQDGERQYADGGQQLSEARAELDDAGQQLADGERELSDARRELDDAKAELEAGAEELAAAKTQLDSARRQLVSGWNQLEEAKEQIRDRIRAWIDRILGEDSSEVIAWASPQSANVDSASLTATDFSLTSDITVSINTALADNVKRLIHWENMPERVLRAAFDYYGGEGEFDPDTARALMRAAADEVIDACLADYTRLANACAAWDNGHRTYRNGRAQYAEGLAGYEEGLQAYNDGEAQYAEGLAQYGEALASYSDGEAAYEQGVKDLAEARAQLDDARQKLDDGEAQYEDGCRALKDAKAQLDEAEEQAASIGPCKWIVMDSAGSISYVQLRDASVNLRSMEQTFSLLFVLVGALVIYATISKMIDEQRSLVGTTKALGFFNREILAKYLLFGVSATVLGVAVGLISALTWTQSFLLGSYNLYFAINLRSHTIAPLPTAVAFAGAVLLAVAAIWFAARKLMQESAIRLMQQAVPKGATKASSRKKPVLSLYTRLILKNIRTDLRRVLVTVVSVAGCCALILVGMTLKHAINGAEKKQFEEIVRHDGKVYFDSDVDPAAMESIESLLRAEGVSYLAANHTNVTIRIEHLDLYELFAGDLGALHEQYALCDAKTGAPIEPTEDGVLVPNRFSELYGLRPGDTFEITVNGTETVTVRIAGVFNTYMDRCFYISDGYYQTLFGKSAEPNVFFVTLSGVDAERLTQSLRSIAGFESYRSADEQRALFAAATSALNAIMLLFIGMAGVMAGVVQMNLTNIYILQKKRELTIMRVNGFTTREVIGYMLRETVVTTALGILLGIGAGTWIGYQIVRTLEQGAAQFDRSVSLIAWLIGAVITIVFTTVVNAIALRKVKHLKLTDV